MNKPLNILFHTHRYPPTYMAGGELMVHRIMRYLKEVCGHNIKVITMNGESATFEGIDVLRYCNNKELKGIDAERDAYLWADVCFAHLSSFRRAATNRRKYGVPLVTVVHNPPQIEREGMNPNNADLALFNAEWCKKRSRWGGESVVVTPPMVYSEWQPNETKGDCITLINLNHNKGGELLERLAKAMPDRKFLAVIGSYGPQLIDPLKRLKNVEIHPHTQDIRSIYKRSRIVLMPSDLETWGMVASESMACGVPVIVSPTEGLMENCAGAGIYANRNDLNTWINAIKSLDDEDFYNHQTQLCRQRFAELCGQGYLKALDEALKEVIRLKGIKKKPVLTVNYTKGTEMSRIEMIALRSFVGAEGTIRKGQKFFAASSMRAEQIAAKGNAKYVERTAQHEAAEKKIIAPSEIAVAEVQEVKSENPQSLAVTTAQSTDDAAEAGDDKPAKKKKSKK